MLGYLLSMEDQRVLGFHQKHLHLCSEDERRSYGSTPTLHLNLALTGDFVHF